jgi:predicted Zn finger-like uncharacterized protein
VIVTCQNCETSFQLDEARVPPQGIRVRCSRCKEAFFLAHPSASDADAIHGVAEDAASEPGPALPGTTQDLAGPAPAVAKPERGEGGGDDEEHDWEFNLDPPRRGRDGSDVESAGPADSGGFELDRSEIGHGSGLSLAGEEEATGGGLAAEGDSAFGSVDDYSSLMPEEDDDAAASPAAGPDETGPGLDAPRARGGEVGRYAETGTSDDLGDPESWDFFGDAPSADPPTPSPGSGAVLGRVALTTSDAGTAGALPDFGALDDDAHADAEEATLPGAILGALGYAGSAVGWAITLGLVAVVIVAGFRGTAESLVRSSQQVGLGQQIAARDLAAHWVDTARGETLLSLRGVLVNESDRAVALDGLVEVSLLDASGQPLDAPARPATVGLPDHAVRELAPGALRVAVDRSAWQLARASLEPGRPVAFQAIFRDVPTRARRFALALAEGGVIPVTGSGPSQAPDASAVRGDASRLEPTAIEYPAVDETADGAAEAPPVAEPTESGLPEELTWGD